MVQSTRPTTSSSASTGSLPTTPPKRCSSGVPGAHTTRYSRSAVASQPLSRKPAVKPGPRVADGQELGAQLQQAAVEGVEGAEDRPLRPVLVLGHLGAGGAEAGEPVAGAALPLGGRGHQRDAAGQQRDVLVEGARRARSRPLAAGQGRVGELPAFVGVVAEADAAVAVVGAEDAAALAGGALDEGGRPVVEPAAAGADQEPREALAGCQRAGSHADPGRPVGGGELAGEDGDGAGAHRAAGCHALQAAEVQPPVLQAVGPVGGAEPGPGAVG